MLLRVVEGVVVWRAVAGGREEGLAVATNQLDLLGGDPVVVKPSELTPVSHVVLHSMGRPYKTIHNQREYSVEVTSSRQVTI